MQFFKIVLSLFILFTTITVAQKKNIAMEIGNEKITKEEIEKMFIKSSGSLEAAQKASKEEQERFIDLFTKYKLKVKEAYQRGYNKNPELQQELAEYKKNLLNTYLIENEIVAAGMQTLYNRKREEIRASHILFTLPQNPTPTDTILAYNKATAIIDSLKKGISFEELAVRNSQDPSAKSNSGDLYYFSAGAMVPEFEDAVYSLKIGDFTFMPVRTQYGYHIIKVTKRKENPGTVQVSHIMKRVDPKANSNEDSLKTITQTILDSLKAGGNFADFAKRHSDDKYSAERGGDLGFLERRRTPKEFDEIAFSLKKGEISGIVKTAYGFHILTVTDTKPVPEFSAIEQELKSQYQRRFNYDFDKLINGLKTKFSYKENSDALAALSKEIDTNKTTSDADWDSSFTSSIKAKTLFSFAGKNYTAESVISLAKTNPELYNLSLKNSSTISTIVDKISKKLLSEYYAETLEPKFASFKTVMKDYEEGVMMFKLEQDEVWSKVSTKDSSLIQSYYEKTKSNYTWPDRVNVQEIFVASDSVAKLVTENLKTLSFDSVATLYNRRPATQSTKGVWGLEPVSLNELTKKGWEMKVGDVSDFFEFEGGFSKIKLLEKDAARGKTFAEAESEVSGAFQESETKRLTNLWFEQLKKKYPVKKYNEVLNTLFSSNNKKETKK